MIDQSSRQHLLHGLRTYGERRISAFELIREYCEPHLNSQDKGLLQIARELAGRHMSDFCDERKIYADRSFDKSEMVYLHFLESNEPDWEAYKRQHSPGAAHPTGCAGGIVMLTISGGLLLWFVL